MARIKSGTLVASTVATVTLDAPYQEVEVVNVSGAAAIYFNVNAAGNPTVAGDDCYVVAGIAGAEMDAVAPGVSNTVVKLISSGVPTYTVIGRG